MITIYHNPGCGTSRNVLKVLEATGEDVRVVEYIDAGWTEAQLLGLFAAADITPREALREKRSPAEELGLLEEGVSQEKIMAEMLKHPVLVNRPIVCTPKGVRMCRPSEAVFDLLDKLPDGPLAKEDGELLIDENGNRVG